MTEYEMIIVGAGSGNSILTPDFDNTAVAIVERGPFGGTCLNRGCIPSKMFIYPADLATYARHSNRLGVDAQVNETRWQEVRDRVFGRIDPIAAGGEDWRKSLDNVTVYNEDARFVGPKELQVGDTTITAPTIVLAAGARPFVPPIPGLDTVDYHTSASIMRIDDVPEHLIVIGGGFIACEMAHVFEGFGAKVTIINRSGRLLRQEDEEIGERFTEVARERFDVVLNAGIDSVSQETSADGPEITVTLNGGTTITGDAMLVAAGRIPNGEQLGVTATGVELDDAGYVVTDEHFRTGVDGIWALGDIELREAGVDFIKAVKPYGDTAYGWAMEDTTSFCKLLADPESRLLLGAHIIGPQASSLIQQLIQGMQFGQTVDEMAKGQMYIHPALTEVVENALLEL